MILALIACSAAYCVGENPSSDPYNFTALGDLVLFSARDEIHGRELWKYDPIRDEVSLLMDIRRGVDDGIPPEFNIPFPVMGTTAFFVAQDDIGGTGIWCTDGTEAGTRMLMPHTWERAELLPRFPTKPAGRVLFHVFQNGQWDLYGTDGIRVERLVPPSASEYVVSTYDATRVLIHRDRGTSPYLSDGTLEGTVALKIQSETGIDHLSLGPRVPRGIVCTMGKEANNSLCVLRESPLAIEPLNTGGPRVSNLAGLGDRCFLQAIDRAHGAELWVTDGTAAGTRVFIDIVPGPRGSDPYSFCRAGEQIYFSADDSAKGRELWATDGTVEGTRLVKDLFAGPGDGHPYRLLALNGSVVFGAHDELAGEELWVSDGTADGTYMLRDIRPGPEFSEPYHFTRVGDVIYFSANDGVNGREMWRTDGTVDGTYLVADVNRPKRAIASGAPHGFMLADGRIWFVARGRDGSAILWRSDATPDGTKPVDIEQPLPTSVRPVLANDTTLVVALADVQDRASLAAVQDRALIPLLPAGVAIRDDLPMVSSNGNLFFTAHDAEHGEELWVYMASHTRAHLVCDIRPGPESSTPSNLHAAQNIVYFSADNGDDGRELWTSDGTAKATMLAADIADGSRSSNPEEFVVWRDDLYFVADDGIHGRELWRHNLVSRESALVRDIYSAQDAAATAPTQLTVCGDMLFFTARTEQHGVELWRSDGTTDGTRLVRDISIGRASSWPRDMTAFDDVLFFSAFTPGDGQELWRSDGTASGTYLVLDIIGGVDSSAPTGLTRVGERLIFVANSELWQRGYRSRELWSTDIEGHIGMVWDIWPGPTGSEPSEFTVLGSQALFRANDGAHGVELWRYDAQDNEAELLKDLLPQTIQMPRRK